MRHATQNPLTQRDIQRGIEKLKTILNDPAFARMTQSVVIGFLGELLVLENLMRDNSDPKHLGKQSSIDIQVMDFRIDVKTSRLREYTQAKSKYWGWALSQGKKKTDSVTNFVAVGLDGKGNSHSYFIIPRDLLDQFPKPNGQYAQVNHSLIWFLDSAPSPLEKRAAQQFALASQLVASGNMIQLKSNQSILNALINLKEA